MIEIAASAFAVVPPEATSLPRSVIVILPVPATTSSVKYMVTDVLKPRPVAEASGY